jgi:cobalamin-dependent methionine synthase I
MKRMVPAIIAPVQVPAYQTPAEKAIEAQNVRSVAQRAGQLVDRMETLAQRFEDTGDTTGLMKAAKEIREGLRLMAQLSGELGPNQTNIQINNVPSMRDSKEWPIIIRVIEAHPEIRDELNQALLEAG